MTLPLDFNVISSPYGVLKDASVISLFFLSDRLQPRQAGNGIQGVTALLDPDLHERVDSFGWNHQEDYIPLLS